MLGSPAESAAALEMGNKPEPKLGQGMTAGSSDRVDTILSTDLAPGDAELGFWPPDLALRLVDGLHSTFDIPWWAAIVGAAIVARTALLPMSIYGMQQGSRMQTIRVPLSQLEARRMAGESDAVIHAELSALYQSHGASPLGIMLPVFVQAPVFVSFFWGLRRLADVRPDASAGGVLWFPDLGATDVTYVLPMLSTGSALALILIGMPSTPTATPIEAQQQRNMRLLFGGLTLVSLPVAINMPASVLLFWNTNNAFSLVYTLAIHRIPGLKDRLIGPLPAAAAAIPKNSLAGVAPGLPIAPMLGLDQSSEASTQRGSSTIEQAHEATVGSLLSLADSLRAVGKLDEALTMATRAHALSEHALGAGHARTQEALRHLEQMHNEIRSGSGVPEADVNRPAGTGIARKSDRA